VLGDPVTIDRYLGITAQGDPRTAANGAGVPAAPLLRADYRRPRQPLSRPTRCRCTSTTFLRYAVSIGASDLHLTSNMPPTVRLHGALRPMEGRGAAGHPDLRENDFRDSPQTQRNGSRPITS